MIAKISFNIEINEEDYDELERIIDHHLDYLVNTEDFPEIQDYWGATLEKVEED